MVKRSSDRPSLVVTADGTGVAAHTGSRLLADMADALGLTAGLSAAMAPTRQRRSAHDPGRVLVDLAVSVADGGTSMSDLKVLRNQPEVFGTVASDPTAWRVLASVDDDVLVAVNAARAAARATAWAAGARPPKDFIVLDLDATLVTSHSEKEKADSTYKKGFGFHPLLCFVDATNDAVAGVLRPGNAGSNTAADHIAVLDAALAQLPVKTKVADPENGEWMLARADSAGCTHGFIDALRERGIEFSVGFPMDEPVREAVLGLAERAWRPAIRQDMEVREEAEVAEITDRLDLSTWPTGTRAIVRREVPHPGAQLTFTDIDGRRFQVFICDSADGDLAYLEARHRGHARVEDRIRNAKQTGLGNFPCHAFVNNAAWLAVVLTACDLLAFTQSLCLEGELAVAEPKRLRYCLLHAAARLIRTGRRAYLRIQANWPWAKDLALAFGRLDSLVLRT
ncbi:MAG: IS1380 family transposase [Gemmatimonadaceae bacterium]